MDHGHYAVRTYFDTVLCFDDRWRCIRHRPVEEINQPILVRRDGDGLVFLFEDGELDEMCSDLRDGRFAVEGDVAGEFRLKLDGWLAAEASGDLGYRDQASSWEAFSLVPAPDLRDRLGTETVRAPTGVHAYPRSSSIPDSIHHVYINRQRRGGSLPGVFVDHVNYLRDMNPGFLSRVWTLQEIGDAVRTWYGSEIAEYYSRINPRYPAAQADLFRYLLLYRMGGAYLDITCGLSRPLREIFSPDDGFVLSHWNDDLRSRFIGMHHELQRTGKGEYQQWFIFSEAGHPYLERVILRVLRNIHGYTRERFGAGWIGVLRTTGPIPYTLSIHEILHSHRHRFIQSWQDGLLFKNVQAGYAFGQKHYSNVNEDVVL